MIMAIYENSWHDNSVDGSTKFPYIEPVEDPCLYFGVETVSIKDAIEYGNHEWDVDVTLYLYDIGSGNYSDMLTLARNEVSGLLEPHGQPLVLDLILNAEYAL